MDFSTAVLHRDTTLLKVRTLAPLSDIKESQIFGGNPQNPQGWESHLLSQGISLVSQNGFEKENPNVFREKINPIKNKKKGKPLSNTK